MLSGCVRALYATFRFAGVQWNRIKIQIWNRANAAAQKHSIQIVAGNEWRSVYNFLKELKSISYNYATLTATASTRHNENRTSEVRTHMFHSIHCNCFFFSALLLFIGVQSICIWYVSVHINAWIRFFPQPIFSPQFHIFLFLDVFFLHFVHSRKTKSLALCIVSNEPKMNATSSPNSKQIHVKTITICNHAFMWCLLLHLLLLLSYSN